MTSHVIVTVHRQSGPGSPTVTSSQLRSSSAGWSTVVNLIQTQHRQLLRVKQIIFV